MMLRQRRRRVDAGHSRARRRRRRATRTMPLNRKRPPVTIQVPNVPRAAYELSSSGTFTEGDLEISRAGLRISGEGTPRRKSPRAGDGLAPLAAFPDGSRGSSREGGARSSADASLADLSVDPPPSADDETGDSDDRAGSSGPASTSDASATFDVVLEELQILGVIGKGSSGIVQRAVHAPTGVSYAVKVIQMNVQAEVRKNIIMELRTLHAMRCDRVVRYHGAYFGDGSISIVLEHMDGGSLSDVTRALGRIPERQLAGFAAQILEALRYLHDEARVVHRDVKPSNVLVNLAGDAKLSDFGVSGQLANSVTKCNSWVGTVTYMSPERISGGAYSFDSDVWSFALSLVECATGRFPYPPNEDEDEEDDEVEDEEGKAAKDDAKDGAKDGEENVEENGKDADESKAKEARAAPTPPQRMGFWDLLDHIVEEPPPRLPRGGRYTDAFRDFVGACLKKTPKERAAAAALVSHEWLRGERDAVDAGAERKELADLVRRAAEARAEAEKHRKEVS